MKHPHILYFFPDQLRRGALACEGGFVPTPHFDRLGREGTSFRRAYVNYPMCTPSRATLLSGRPAHALRTEDGLPYLGNDLPLAGNTVTYPKCLTRAGYECSYFGKWHNQGKRGPVPPGPVRMGFDHGFFGFETGPSRERPFYYDDAGHRIDAPENWAPFHDVARAIEVLEAGHTRAPQMLAVSCDPPHEPYDYLPPDIAHFFDEALESVVIPENVPEELREEARDMIARYHAQVRGVDMALGRLLDTLDRLGIADNTIVVVGSDHGDQVLSHGLQAKNQFYEESLNVPLIVRWPGRIPAGRRVEEGLVDSCDIAPTLLDLAGVEVPDCMMGTSLRPCLLDGADAPHQAVFSECEHPWFDWMHGQGWQGRRRCVVTRRHKLVVRDRGPDGAEPYRFYDLETDPNEVHNRAEDAACLPLITRLGGMLLAHMAETADPFLENMLGDMPSHSRAGVYRALGIEPPA